MVILVLSTLPERAARTSSSLQTLSRLAVERTWYPRRASTRLPNRRGRVVRGLIASLRGRVTERQAARAALFLSAGVGFAIYSPHEEPNEQRYRSAGTETR